ncbi:SIS domain-containing protein [Sulfidibacter corallicola]|uniref:SIS domain-containing protein n=1 Tax=Sulfidibacter corallicola TaxID=2818388 RepID=A0A8A4TRT0_SULCO|nr:hypothetical protein [Sulfidibacter corallicola]QTD49245.1 hypothetical protein J3U87_26975 [Sulfidibacter corallicola]
MRMTEMDHPHTSRLDRVPTIEALNLLADADRELFGSDAWGAGLLDPDFLAGLEALWRRIHDTLRKPGGRVVFGGAGTSGRLALQCAATSGKPQVHGLLAGGMAAYFRAREGVEDSPAAGHADLVPYLADPGPAVYVGITCGLSAAYVAGQVAACLDRPDTTVAVLGFTSPGTAVDRPLTGLGRHGDSFRALLATMQEMPDAFVLTPAIGPEPLTGSTRMKGGTATKITLDVLLGTEAPRARIETCRQVLADAYHRASDLSHVIEAAVACLAEDGQLVYLAPDRLGLMAILDASECPPTFGAKPNQVQARVPGTVTRWLPGFDMSLHRLVPVEGWLGDGAKGRRIPPRAVLALRPPEAILPPGVAVPGDAILLTLPEPDAVRTWDAGLRDLWWKWRLNAVSTLGFVGAGKVFGNRMIDLRISNLKLYTRACRIVAHLGRCSEDDADDVLRRLLDATVGVPREALIARAVRQTRLVPRAALVARGLTPEAAEARLRRHPKIVDALAAEGIE